MNRITKSELLLLLSRHLRETDNHRDFGNLLNSWMVLTGRRFRKPKPEKAAEPPTVEETDVHALVLRIEEEAQAARGKREW